MPAEKRKKKTGKTHSKGELNRLTDSCLHPLYKNNQLLRILDGLVHAAIEQNPKESAKKFLIYNGRDILKEIIDKL
jgi:hypothetical protein